MFDLPILTQPSTMTTEAPSNGLKVFVESYGCQMNTNDSEIVMGVMHANGYRTAGSPDDADVVLLNTCAIRDNAEKKIHERLMHLKHFKKSNRDLVVGVLGCMAERLRADLLETKLVDLVVGPDEYRRVPELVNDALGGSRSVAVKLSRTETYDDVVPLRTGGASAWTSIMRGCDKFCTFCVVPFTRGRERSRPLQSIVDETKGLWDSGFKEITLLGQNVNSYRDIESGYDFSDLLAATARAVPSMRIRYSTSHPQDMSDKLIYTMAEHSNICKHVHLPVQSGSNRILELMNRTYTVEHYIGRIERIKELMPDCATTTDIITGFCTETEEDHQRTIELMKHIRYEGAYMFTYSPRENTKAWKLGDDVPDEVKSRRLAEIIEIQSEIARQINTKEVGVVHEVLVDGPSKRDASHWKGRTDTNKIVVFSGENLNSCAVGHVVCVKIERTNKATLVGHATDSDILRQSQL